jgi:hypothetical protein
MASVLAPSAESLHRMAGAVAGLRQLHVHALQELQIINMHKRTTWSVSIMCCTACCGAQVAACGSRGPASCQYWCLLMQDSWLYLTIVCPCNSWHPSAVSVAMFVSHFACRCIQLKPWSTSCCDGLPCCQPLAPLLHVACR